MVDSDPYQERQFCYNGEAHDEEHHPRGAVVLDLLMGPVDDSMLAFYMQ